MRYIFKETGNVEVDKLVKRFDKQIKDEYLLNDGNKFLCPSYWSKLLFLKTMDLDINDIRLLHSFRCCRIC